MVKNPRVSFQNKSKFRVKLIGNWGDGRAIAAGESCNGWARQLGTRLATGMI